MKNHINQIRRMLVNGELIKKNGLPYSSKTISFHNNVLVMLIGIMEDISLDSPKRDINRWVMDIRLKLRSRGNETVTENSYIGSLKWAIGRINEVFDANIVISGAEWSHLPEPDTMYVPDHNRVMDLIKNFTPDTGNGEKAMKYITMAAMTGARYSDMSSWTTKNIVNGKITYTPKKTGKREISVPINEIMANAIGSPKLLPRIPYTTLMDEVKKIFRNNGFTGDVIRRRMVGGEVKTDVRKEWELVSLHRLRASAITGFLQSGASEMEAKYFSGHSKNSKSFGRYVEFSKKHIEAKILVFQNR